jgi:MFS family permease
MNLQKTKNTFRAFGNRNYALYFAGQGVSQIGTWMQRTGVSWVIYTLTHSTFMLGLTVFASQFPSFLLSLYGGIISDRYNRHRILLITQTASMIQALLLALLILTNHYVVWEILTLSVILGVINAFDVPARHPLVMELVPDKADLPNALALNSSMVSLARIVGPALSGIVLVTAGAGICFMLNALSFVAVIVSLLFIKLPPFVPSLVKKRMSSEFKEGFNYLKATPAIGVILLMLAFLALLIFPYDTVLPVFAKVIYKGDAATYGYISSFMGIGAIGGTFFLASLKKGTELKRILLVNTLLCGICLALFSQITYFPLAMVFAILTGFTALSLTTICMTIIQVNSDIAMRGRIMSYVALAFFGMLPLGSLLVGSLSQHIGAPNTLLIEGILAVLIAIVFSRFLRRDKLKQEEMEDFKEEEEIVIKNI